MNTDLHQISIDMTASGGTTPQGTSAPLGTTGREQVAPTTRQAAIATGAQISTDAAAAMLRRGGNAIDAAVAAAWALAVCEPAESGIGGQTVMLVRFPDGRLTVIDGTSRAPGRVSLDTVNRYQQRRGYRACTIPTTPATLDYAQRRYGRLGVADVLQPAIHAAEDGFTVTRRYRQILKTILRLPDRHHALRTLFLRRNGKCYRVGEKFRQPELTTTLKRLATDGAEDFYRGQLARDIAADMTKHGGLLSDNDLASYHGPTECAPLTGMYHSHRVATTPPPTGGLQLLLALHGLQELQICDYVGDESAWRELLALATSGVLRDRDLWPDDPTYVTPSYLGWQLSNARGREIADTFLSQSSRDNFPTMPEGPGDTTHLCVADSDGLVVSLTQSIQSVFGAKVAHPTLGFVYNNYLYTCNRQGMAYRLAGGCCPRSNIAPSIVFAPEIHDGDLPSVQPTSAGRVKLVLGSAGSRRILSSLLQVISQVIDRRATLAQALAAPRVHGLSDGKVWVERDALTQTLRKRLEQRFVKIRTRSNCCRDFGAVQAIHFDGDGTATAAADPRRDGVGMVLPQG